MEQNQIWWKVRCGKNEGFAAKYYFARRDAPNDYEQEPWFFGTMTRQTAVRLLRDPANPDGSFLVRYTSQKDAEAEGLILNASKKSDRGRNVLFLKHLNADEKYEYVPYPIETDGHSVWHAKHRDRKYTNLNEMIETLKLEKNGVKSKLTSVCLIPKPHSDPDFEFYNKDHDSVFIPNNQIEILRSRKHKVTKARLRGYIGVAVKKLEFRSKEEGSEKVTTYLGEIGNLKKMKHPNLVDLFGYSTNEQGETFLVQELMPKGNLKDHLQVLQKGKKIFGKSLLLWAFQVARGMQWLESLQLVHGNLSAR